MTGLKRNWTRFTQYQGWQKAGGLILAWSVAEIFLLSRKIDPRVYGVTLDAYRAQTNAPRPSSKVPTVYFSRGLGLGVIKSGCNSSSYELHDFFFLLSPAGLTFVSGSNESRIEYIRPLLLKVPRCHWQGPLSKKCRSLRRRCSYGLFQAEE